MEKGPEAKLLESGFSEAKAITKKYAATFYLASHLLPREKKLASYAIYAICRISDEAVDNGNGAKRQEDLNRIKNNIEAAYGDAALGSGLLAAFRDSAKKYNIPKKHFEELLSGMEMDLKKTRYENFEELRGYSYKVAGVVGLIMLKIFGCRGPQAEEYAVDLGIALQLTNILRDINEDYGRKRIYLPRDEMLKYGVSEDDIARGIVSENFKAFMKFQIARARQYYLGSDKGIRLIDNRSSRLVASGMKRMYSGILDEIENKGYDVFSSRAQVSKIKKLAAISKIILTVK